MQYITINSITPSGQPSISSIQNDKALIAKTIAILKNKGHINITVE